MNRFRWYGPSIVLVGTVILVMLAGPRIARRIVWAKTDAEIVRIKQTLEANPTLAELSNAFRKVAEVVEPSVVHIQIMQKQKRRAKRSTPNLPFPFKTPEQFQHPEKDSQGESNEFDKYDQRLRPVGNGSGWVYDENGHIITNNHVVEEADEIIVKFANGSEYKATVIGRDPKSDVAVIQIDNGDLHPANIAEQPVRQGDIVFAFGSPFGEEFSMSQGIVSGVGRNLGILNRYDKRGFMIPGYENFIQTDAAINPGNSGGPLTNIYGEVVGMNTAIRTNSSSPFGGGSFSGVGYTIPVKQVTRIAAQLIEKGKVTRGFLGITMNAMEPDLSTFGFDGEGVLVDDASPGFPANKAGIQAGDIITQIETFDIKDSEQLRRLIASYLPGDKIDIQIFRNGEYQTKTVKLVELTDEILAGGGIAPQEDAEPLPLEKDHSIVLLQQLGIEQIQTLTETVAEEKGIEYKTGVIITKVRPRSLASQKGIRENNVIVSILGPDGNDVAVKDTEQLTKATKDIDTTKSIRLRIFDGQRTRYVFLKLEK